MEPLLPLLPLAKRIENMGLHQVDLGLALGSWLDVIRRIMERDRVDYETAAARLDQDLDMLKVYRDLVYLKNSFIEVSQ